MKCACILLLASLAISAGDGKPDLTGHWVLNTDKSTFGKLPKPNGMTLDARYEGGVFRAQQNVDRQEGQESSSSEWITDGNDHVLPGASPEMHQRTYWQGSTLVNVRHAQDGSFDQTIRISVSADKKIATEVISTRGKEGSTTARLIWDKRP